MINAIEAAFGINSGEKQLFTTSVNYQDKNVVTIVNYWQDLPL
jgi:hypothetical protein